MIDLKNVESGQATSPALGQGMISATCRICYEPGPHRLYLVREMFFGSRDPFEYFECSFCGCLQIVSVPEDISRYYPQGYYAHSESPVAQFANPLRAKLLRERTKFAISGRGLIGRTAFNRKPEWGAASLRPLHPSRTTSILDVGCGTGLRLYILCELGFQNLLGVDPHIKASQTYRNGLKIEKKSLRDIAGSWEIIMFHHAFEHIHNPLETLQQVRRLLAPNGHCILRIPTAESHAWEHYRTDWVQLDAPRHFFLHTRASINHLANASGLRLTGVAYDSTEFQFVGSELYRRNISLTDSATHPRLFSKTVENQFKAEAKKLNAQGKGDSAAFYLTTQSL
jgi:SAM-dependent methyltransferase